MKSLSLDPITDEVIKTSKSNLLDTLDLLPEKVILIGQDHIGLEEKMHWLKSSNTLPESFKYQIFESNQSNEKESLLHELHIFLDSFKIPSRLKSLITTCADEFLMNAFFDAPVEEGVVTHKHTHRSINVSSNKPVKFIFGYNSHEIALGVLDQYGSVNSSSIVKHIKKTFVEETYQEPTRGTGAGIGLSLCVKRNTSLLIKVTPNQFSQFTAFFPIVENFKEYLEKSQLIGIHIEKT